MKKKILLCLLVLCSVFSLTGCGKKEEAFEELALEYLNNTYYHENDTFTFVRCGYDLFPGSNDRCYFKSEKYKEDITVYLSKEDNKYFFSDNYFKLYMKEAAEKYFYDIASQYSTMEVKIRFNSLKLPETLDSTSSFNDYVASGKCDIEVYFISKNNFSSQQITSILNEVINNKIYGEFRFIITNDENLLSDYTISEIVNEQQEKVLSKENYSINSNLEISKSN